MNVIIKSTIATCGFIATVSMPLTVGAETFVFSGKDAYGNMGYDSGQVSVFQNGQVSVFQNATKSKSFPKTVTSGAYFYGSYYDSSNGCYFSGWGSTTERITFKATTGRRTITASGAIPVVWSCYSGEDLFEYPDTVSFNMNLSAISDQESRSWGTNHYEYGVFKQNNHFDSSYASAALNASSITSTRFGSWVPTYGSVGNSKGHYVDIVK